MEYNDNELLYLTYEGSEVAIKILYKKYYKLINSRLQKFNIKPQNYEDFFQEGLMALHVAINLYNPFYKKSFNKFFDLILQRRIMNILRKEKKYFYDVSIVDDLNYVVKEDHVGYCQVEYYNSIFKGFTKEVFNLRFIKNYKPREIATIMNCSIKKIYNTIYYIRKKIHMLQK